MIVKKTAKISNGVNKKLIVILGPTASGKSELAIKLALRLSSGQAKKKFGINGAEIVSADSRQVYKGMDIGTGKVTKKEMQGIPHHLLDVASPKRRFTLFQYRKLAVKAINKILKRGKPRTTFQENCSKKSKKKKVVRGKIPILCGGTGFYIQAVIDGIIIPEVKPDWKLRKKMEKKTVKELFEKLKRLDPERAKTIEKENKRRLIRALEIIIKTKKPVPILKKQPRGPYHSYPVLMIGIKKTPEELKRLIKKRFFKWLKQGLIKEVKKLRKIGLSWKKIEEFGIHYRVVAQYLQKKLNYKEMIENSLKELQNYAKRQMTWFKRDKRIKWIDTYREAEKLVNPVRKPPF